MLNGITSSAINLMSSKIGYALFYSTFCDNWLNYVMQFENDYAQEDFIDHLSDIKYQVSRNRHEEGFMAHHPCMADGMIF